MTAFSQHHCRAGRPDDRETFACLPSSLWGHSGQMTAEAFGRLASWSSFNIVVGRHDEFAHSRVAIPQKRGTTAKSIVLHFPPSHTLKLETPERRHSCHTRHSHYPRGRGTPRKNRQNTRSVPHPLAQIHAQCTAPPITMFGRPRWSGPGRRFRYDFPALSSMIRGGCCRRERGRPMTADRNQAGYTDASGAHGAGLVVMWVRRGRPDSSEPAATGKPS